MFGKTKWLTQWTSAYLVLLILFSNDVLSSTEAENSSTRCINKVFKPLPNKSSEKLNNSTLEKLRKRQNITRSQTLKLGFREREVYIYRG